MKTLDDLYSLIKAWVEQQEADACTGCKYLKIEDWEMPCKECERSHKDYWRPEE